MIEKVDERAIEVNRIAKEGEIIVPASSFEVKSTVIRSIDDLEMPTNLKAEDIPNKKGQAKVTFKKDADAVNTALEYQNTEGVSNALFALGTPLSILLIFLKVLGLFKNLDVHFVSFNGWITKRIEQEYKSHFQRRFYVVSFVQIGRAHV